MGGRIIDAPPIPYQALESFLSDTRARIESLEESVYGAQFFVLRLWRIEFRIALVRRIRRPDARMDRIRSEER